MTLKSVDLRQKDKATELPRRGDKRNTHPYIPLYVDDYDAATAHLTPEEDGVYNRLLRLSWRTAGCSLPDDPAWIARKVRLSSDDFERVCRPLLEEFFTLQRGRFVQRRLKREYDDISRKKLARKLAGKKGGNAKALKEQENSPSNASVLPAHTRAFPEPNPNPEPIDSSEGKPSADLLDFADPAKLAWDMAGQLLTERGGMTLPKAKAFFGKLLRDNGIEARDLMASLAQAVNLGTADPQSYLTKAARGAASRRTPPEKRVGFV